ncbi:hypothetical protein [Actinomadura sp. DC4]|uniref:hypothetical protein n=1 Tax=Actinomadura sp. DC4 TaxID=3055069 RepID=UPI0025AEF946|nr:hypothetical protein [Actinomadura sp. DC4]MDN3353039.1 hypothetical protein [Actinomadura sp. DC4]
MAAVVDSVPSSRSSVVGRRSAWALAGASVVGGLLLAVIWSSYLVDDSIGQNVADGVLRHSAETSAIGGTTGAAIFAFVSGFAGTFTACNFAVFGALPQVTGAERSRWTAPLATLGWIVGGMLAVSVAYGFVGVLIGSDLPQLSTRVIGNGMPERLLQSVVAFGVIGLIFVFLGLGSLGLIPDPLAARPRARSLVLGALIGGFLIGRPYPLFHKLADWAVATHNPFAGALTFGLQSLGNILVVGLLGFLMAVLGGGALGRWIAARPRRASAMAGVALLALGAFLVIYWDVRLPAAFGYGWFPTMPWNN